MHLYPLLIRQLYITVFRPMRCYYDIYHEQKQCTRNVGGASQAAHVVTPNEKEEDVMTSERALSTPAHVGHAAHPARTANGAPRRPGPPAGFADAVRLLEPQAHGNLIVVPLAFARDRGPRYVTLAEALRSGSLHVTEVSDGGSVPTLRVVNQGAVGVLVLDGEELVGAKQNRVLNTTVFVRAKSSLDVPVSCVEAGRWHYQGHEFHDEEFVVHATVRRAVHESVSMSLRAAAGHRSDQGRVWREIETLQSFGEQRSHTGAHRDVYRQRAHDIAGYLEAFPLLQGQHGLLVLRAGEVVGLDFVSRAASYAGLHDKLLRSYAFDAVTREMERSGHDGRLLTGRAQDAERGNAGSRRRGTPSRRAILSRADSFLETIAELPASSFKSPGRGWDVRCAGERVSGSMLVVEGVAVHGAFFVAQHDASGAGRCDPGRSSERMAGVERRRAYRRREV